MFKQKIKNTFYTSCFLAMFVVAGCGDDDYNGSPIVAGTSPVGSSTVQVIPNCSGGIQAESIDVRANTFSPGSETIAVGQIVKFENFDAINHTVTGGAPNAPDNRFDITLTPNGTTNRERCLRFSASGTYRYYDRLNPNMTAQIVVQ